MRVMYKILNSRAFEEFCCVSTPDDVPDVDTIGRFRNMLIKHEKNKEKKRDPEAHSAKKGNMWHFGYKAHIGVDSNSGLVHHIETMPANEHDVTKWLLGYRKNTSSRSAKTDNQKLHNVRIGESVSG